MNNTSGSFVLASSLLSMLLAQCAKLLLTRLRHKRWQLNQLASSGGMPSSHSALMTTLTVCMYLLFGWRSTWFAIAVVSSIVVMYDAIGVRRQAGEQAMVLGELISQVHKAGIKLDPVAFEQFRHWKRQGHTPREVIGGIIVGIVVALVCYRLF